MTSATTSRSQPEQAHTRTHAHVHIHAHSQSQAQAQALTHTLQAHSHELQAHDRAQQQAISSANNNYNDHTNSLNSNTNSVEMCLLQPLVAWSGPSTIVDGAMTDRNSMGSNEGNIVRSNDNSRHSVNGIEYNLDAMEENVDTMADNDNSMNGCANSIENKSGDNNNVAKNFDNINNSQVSEANGPLINGDSIDVNSKNQDDFSSGNSNLELARCKKKIMPLPHGRSPVWLYFGFLVDDNGNFEDKKRIICKICSSSLTYSGNTTNLFMHLKTVHTNIRISPRGSDSSPPQLCSNASSRMKTTENFHHNKSPRFEEKAIKRPAPSPTKQVRSSVSSSSMNLGASSSSSYPDSKISNLIISCDQQQSINCDAITRAIVDMLVHDCRPLTMVTSQGFIDLMRLVAPNYRIPDRQTLKRLIKDKYRNITFMVHQFT